MTLAAEMKSPIDRAISAKNSAKRQRSGIPEQRAKFRHAPKPPIDFVTVETDSLHGPLMAIHKTWNLISEASRDQNINMSELADLGRKNVERVLAQTDGHLSLLEKQKAIQQTELQSKIAPQIDSVLAQEIRESIHRVRASGKPQIDQLRAAVEADPRIFSAMSSVPSLVSGLKTEELGALKKHAINTHAPEEGAALDATTRDIGRLQHAQKRIVDEMAPCFNRWIEPENAAISELKGDG